MNEEKILELMNRLNDLEIRADLRFEDVYDIKARLDRLENLVIPPDVEKQPADLN